MPAPVEPKHSRDTNESLTKVVSYHLRSRVDLIWVSAASRRNRYDGCVDDRIERARCPTPRSRRPGGEPPRVIESEQDNLAAVTSGARLSQELSPATLRSCAARCLAFAARQPDPLRAELFRALAVSFQQHATIKERRLTSRAI